MVPHDNMFQLAGLEQGDVERLNMLMSKMNSRVRQLVEENGKLVERALIAEVLLALFSLFCVLFCRY